MEILDKMFDWLMALTWVGLCLISVWFAHINDFSKVQDGALVLMCLGYGLFIAHIIGTDYEKEANND